MRRLTTSSYSGMLTREVSRGNRRAQPDASLTLTGGFELTVSGRPVELGHGSARLIAYLALAGREVRRAHVAEELWQGTSSARASSNLRTALWRLPAGCVDLVRRRGDTIGIDAGLHVDVDDLVTQATNADGHVGGRGEVGRLMRLTDLLPGWEDAWLVVERERLRLLCLNALESAASASARAGRPATALELATAALRVEPLRETAWRIVVAAHQEQGNLAAAATAYRDYVRLLREELGIGPSELMEQLVDARGVRPRTG